MTAAGTDTTHTDLIEDKSMNNWFRKSPIQRQRWGDKQLMPHVNWGDLFFDLFYVVSNIYFSYIYSPLVAFLCYYFLTTNIIFRLLHTTSRILSKMIPA